MAKRQGSRPIVLAAILLATAVLFGCKAETPPSFLSHQGIPVHAKQLLNLDTVEIVLPAPITEAAEPPVDPVMEKRIADLVEERIQSERNIEMKIVVVWPDDPFTGNFALKTAAKMVADGDPPEVVYAYDDPTDADGGLWMAPVALDDAMTKYGPNLSKIPLNQMEPCYVGEKLYSLPLVRELSWVPMLNGLALEKHGWQEPKTLEDLANLLAKAKEAGMAPIFSDPINVLQEMLPDNATLPDSATVKGAKLLPVTLQGQQGLVLGGADKVTTNCFFAFDKPEALVTLMDWSVTNSDNSLLMTYGEKDTDYKLMGKSRLERLQKRVACFSAFFGAAWLYPEPTENCESPGLIAALDDVAKAAGAMRGGEFVSLPSSSMRYARPGSDLMKAWDGAKRVSAGNIAFARIRQGLNWEDLMNAAPPTDADYETMPQYDEKLKLYLKLLEDYLAGRYDPKVDMVNVPDR